MLPQIHQHKNAHNHFYVTWQNCDPKEQNKEKEMNLHGRKFLREKRANRSSFSSQMFSNEETEKSFIYRFSWEVVLTTEAYQQQEHWYA